MHSKLLPPKAFVKIRFAAGLHLDQLE